MHGQSIGLIPGCQHFYWSEVTKVPALLPRDPNIVSRCVALGRYLESVRRFCGNRPIIITSWYRDPAHNRRIGGSSNSRHLYGDAVDFYLNNELPTQTYYRIDAFHGNRGGLGKYASHVHLDLRGIRARW